MARDRGEPLPPACVTPSPTSTPVPPKAAQATARPTPADVPPDDIDPAPTATPGPCWLTDEQWGDPDNNYDVIEPYVWPDGSPALDSDGNQIHGPVQIPCDATPTPTPEPTEPPAAPAPPRATATRRPAPPPAPALAPARSLAPAAAPTRPVPTLTPPPDTPTPAPTATATVTPTPAPTDTPTVRPTPTALAAVAAAPRPPAEDAQPRTASWALLLEILGVIAALTVATYALYRWRRHHYEAEVQALEGEPS
jgi:hypothetical protein